MILTISLDSWDPWKHPDPKSWFCCPLNAFRKYEKSKYCSCTGYSLPRTFILSCTFRSNTKVRTNEIPIKVNTDIVPVKNAYPRKDCGDRNLKTVWKYNQRPRVFAIRTVQNLGNMRECVALTYKVSSDVRPCRESLVKRSISFLFRSLYDPQTAKEGKF